MFQVGAGVPGDMPEVPFLFRVQDIKVHRSTKVGHSTHISQHQRDGNLQCRGERKQNHHIQLEYSTFPLEAPDHILLWTKGQGQL
jgi:hypothetical protein